MALDKSHLMFAGVELVNILKQFGQVFNEHGPVEATDVPDVIRTGTELVVVAAGGNLIDRLRMADGLPPRQPRPLKGAGRPASQQVKAGTSIAELIGPGPLAKGQVVAILSDGAWPQWLDVRNSLVVQGKISLQQVHLDDSPRPSKPPRAGKGAGKKRGDDEGLTRRR